MTDNRPAGQLSRNAQRGQTPGAAPIRGQVARPWLAKYNTPSRIGDSFGDPITPVSQLVGRVLLLTTVESGRSASKGRFTRWTFQEVDVDTGELLGEPDLMLAFAQPVVRTADHLAGGTLDGRLVLNPPLAVRVDRAGDVVLFVDP